MRIVRKWSLLLLLLGGLLGGVELNAQEGDPPPFLEITGSDSNSPPVMALRAFALDSSGRPFDLSAQPLQVEHGTQIIDSVAAERQLKVGTFTIFLIDATSGAAAQLPLVQQFIEQYASPDYMDEQIDAVALYQVGSTQATELLPPSQFYNSVRNFLAAPLETAEGSTALYDSVVGLLGEMETLSPDPSLLPVLVVVSDGTDAVSSEATADDVAARAAELRIPLFTVWLENEDLTTGQETGRAFLQETAADARGLAGRLDQPATMTAILNRIDVLGSQWLIQYPVENLVAGQTPVTLRLVNEPALQAQTTVNISAGAPLVALNIPVESRTLSLPDLNEPVTLGFSATTSWLDGNERALQQAQLLVNEQVVADLAVDNLSRIRADIGNFVYGANYVQVAVTDDQGLQARSPEIPLTVNEGPLEIPAALRPGFALAGSPVLYCLGALLLLGLFGFGGVLAYRSGRFSGLFRPRRSASQPRPVSVSTPPDLEPLREMGRAERARPADAASPVRVSPAVEGDGALPGAYLQIMQAETQLPSRVPLAGILTRLGRSPQLADIAFTQDITVSRLHATIRWDGQNYRLYDDGSTSGTWINGQKLPDYGAPLFDGDEIALGKVTVYFRLEPY